jgi:hypothetical protein
MTGKNEILPSRVAVVFRTIDKAIPAVIAEKAAYRAALRALPVVVKATPSDRGVARAAWDVSKVPGGAELFNTAPYAAVLEVGAAPHRPPLMPILRWVVRKFGLNLEGMSNVSASKKKKARRGFSTIKDVPWLTYLVAKSIQDKIEKQGSKPHGMIAKNLTFMQLAYSVEVAAALAGMKKP